MGRSFQEYVYRKRIEAAKKLITSTDDPLHRISTRCGFGSPLSFYRAFRKLEDCTPKEYRIRSAALVSDET
jgi:AraC-like DNA-binding protein